MAGRAGAILDRIAAGNGTDFGCVATDDSRFAHPAPLPANSMRIPASSARAATAFGDRLPVGWTRIASHRRNQRVLNPRAVSLLRMVCRLCGRLISFISILLRPNASFGPLSVLALVSS